MVTSERALADTLQQLTADLGLSDRELATILGASPSALQRWRVGVGVAPSGETRDRFRHLMALHHRLHDTFEAPGVPRWLRDRSGYLGGLTPLDALLDADFDSVNAALEALDSGVFI